MSVPYVVTETNDYAVLFKPARFHSVPLKGGGLDPTLLEWYAELCPEVRYVHGARPWEGGIVHRIDYETKGLVLTAKTQNFLDHILEQQALGLFVKEYRALSAPLDKKPPDLSRGLVIKSAFTPFGPGRKLVKALVEPYPSKKEICLDKGNYYQTEILDSTDHGGNLCLRVRLLRGFRHQVRCHLAWIGLPIVNDVLYGGPIEGVELGLTAESLRFFDREGQQIRVSIGGF